MTVELTRTTRLPTDIETAFDLSLTVEVHVESFSRSQERAVAGVTSGVMKLDEEVTWRARHFGRVWTMRSRISALERPTRFVDEQVRGPFAQWWHEHRFTPIDDTTTEMVDVIVFRAPLGILGRIAERIGLTWYMRRLIDARNDTLVRLASADRSEHPDVDMPPAEEQGGEDHPVRLVSPIRSRRRTLAVVLVAGALGLVALQLSRRSR